MEAVKKFGGKNIIVLLGLGGVLAYNVREYISSRVTLKPTTGINFEYMLATLPTNIRAKAASIYDK